MRIWTEKDAVALASLREKLAEVADAATGGYASREARNRVCDLIADMDSAFAADLAWCHASSMPDVRYDPEVGWTIRCYACGSFATRRTLSEAEERWNDLVSQAEIEEGSE